MEHLALLLVGEAFDAAEQPAAADPLGSQVRAAAAAQGLGGAAADVVDHLVGQFNDMEVIDTIRACGKARRTALA